ncbi:MAG TPA: lipopolysaccharide transport periplasmic protein LptA [Geobacteraceae bacterium]
MTRVLIIAVTWLALAGWAAGAPVAGERNSQPIQIKSDELLTDSGKKTATFTGKVVARQADITMYADRLIITYADKSRDVEKVEAFGNVRITQGNRLAQAAHAFYDNKAGRIILDGTPKVIQGDDVVTGKVITYYVNEERSVVTGGPDERVNAVIHPRDKGKNDGARP